MGEISNRRIVRKKDKPGGRNERKKIYTVSKEAMDKLVEDSERASCKKLDVTHFVDNEAGGQSRDDVCDIDNHGDH